MACVTVMPVVVNQTLF